MLHTPWVRAPVKTFVAISLVVISSAFLIPNAAGVTRGSNAGQDAGPSSTPSNDDRGRMLGNIVRVERDFIVQPHSLAINQILQCPTHPDTKLVGGGTTLLGEPSRPATAPIVYTNGPVGDIIANEEQSWASEVANNSDETFTYRQFALCVVVRSEDEEQGS